MKVQKPLPLNGIHNEFPTIEKFFTSDPPKIIPNEITAGINNAMELYSMQAEQNMQRAIEESKHIYLIA